MQSVKDILGNSNNAINDEDYDREKDLIIDCNNYNNSVGNLNLIDNINCDICKNKGKIAFVSDGFLKNKNCSCMIKRNTFKRMANCGIDKTVLEHYSFRNWQKNNSWQDYLLTRCKDFYRAYKNERIANWFIISGQSGCGKTHLCTALFQEMILSFNLSGLYFMWNDEIPRLLSLRKSSYVDNQEKYDLKMKELKEIDVLYIDDLFKLDNRYKEESLSIAFEILNYRYINNKMTIISTEIEKNQFENIDTAIWGRCNEKTDNGNYWTTIVGSEKNFRIKGE